MNQPPGSQAVEPWELRAPWNDQEAEYQVLTDLLVPAAQGRFDRAHQDWDALDTKALGMIAVDAAAIAGLAAVHDAINRLWWLPTLAFVAAGLLMVASIWPRVVTLGPDLADLHDQLREQSPLDAARLMFNETSAATSDADGTLERKVFLFWLGLAVLSVSLVASFPIILLP